MVNILLALFMVILIVVCAVMTVIILMQKPSANAGMGAALGGGAAESVFGGETANVLLKYTVRISVAFFLLSFLMYLGLVAKSKHTTTATGELPKMDMPTSMPAKPATATAGLTANTTTTGTAPTNGTAVTQPPQTMASPPAPAKPITPASVPAASSTK